MYIDRCAWIQIPIKTNLLNHDLLIHYRDSLPDLIKLGNENRQLSKDNNALLNKLSISENRNRELEKALQILEEKYKSENDNLKSENDNLKSEIKKLNKRIQIIKSVNSKDLKESKTKNSENSDYLFKKNTKIQKSKSMGYQLFHEDSDDRNEDEILTDKQKINKNQQKIIKSPSSILLPPSSQQKKKIPSNPESPKPETQISNHNEKSQSSDDEFLNNFLDTAIPFENEKKDQTKKVSLLPTPQMLPELLEDVKKSELHEIHLIVTRILATSFPSMTAMKEYYVNILNSYALTLRKIPLSSPDIHQIATFFVTFANRVSPSALENFKKTLTNHKELLSLIEALETTPLFDE